jgi:hypothetical protein
MSQSIRAESSGEPEIEQRSWWSRNWKWAAPLGCLIPILLCGGCLMSFVYGVWTTVTTSAPYQDSLAAAQASPAVREALGQPIEPQLVFQGRYDSSNGQGFADLHYGIAGPDGEGTVYVAGEFFNDAWIYQEMRVRLDTGEEIDLRPESDVPDEAAEPAPRDETAATGDSDGDASNERIGDDAL